MCIISESWLQLNIHVWMSQKKAEVDTETMRTIFAQTAVYCYTDSLVEYTPRTFAGIISKYSVCSIWTKLGENTLSTWWRHQMETFSASLALCVRNSPVTGEFPAQRPVTRNFDVFFDLRLNKRLSKQSWGWWFETQPLPLWSHSN